MLAFVFHIEPCPGAYIPSRMEMQGVGCSWCLCVPNTHTEGGKSSEQEEILHDPTGRERFDNTNGLVGPQFCCPVHTLHMHVHLPCTMTNMATDCHTAPKLQRPPESTDKPKGWKSKTQCAQWSRGLSPVPDGPEVGCSPGSSQHDGLEEETVVLLFFMLKGCAQS